MRSGVSIRHVKRNESFREVKIQLNRHQFVNNLFITIKTLILFMLTHITHVPKAVLCAKESKPPTESVLAQLAAKVQLGNVQKIFLFAKLETGFDSMSLDTHPAPKKPAPFN